MKVVPSNDRPKKQPLLPLVPEGTEEMDSSNSVSYSLRVNPTDANSPTFKKYVRVLAGGESVRGCLQWSRDSAAVITGLNITDAKATYDLYGNLLTGSALTLFQQQVIKECQAAKTAAVDAQGDASLKRALKARTIILFLTDDMVKHGRQAVLRGLIPNKIVAMVKRYLRRECRKPADVKIRTYYQHLTRINESELPELPPFKEDQNLPADEIVDILIYATPKSWMREMDRQGFDPISKTPLEVVDFQERIEQAEETEGPFVDRSQNKASSSLNNKKKKKQRTDGVAPGSKFCLKHGKCSHTSDECEVLKKLAEQSNSSSGGGKFGNKTWSRKADDAKKASKKELAAFVKKAVAAKVKKELNSIDSKKRKSDDDSFDLNAIEQELKDFNYEEELEKLSIDSDDEISV